MDSQLENQEQFYNKYYLTYLVITVYLLHIYIVLSEKKMPKKIDDASLKILDFLKDHRYENYRLKDIAQYSGLDHLQKVTHRINQLEKLGYIRKDYESDSYEVLEEPVRDVIYLPLYGSALCGHAGQSILEETPQEMIPVSTLMLNISKPEEFLLVRAQGNSMEPLIKSGDIVLVRLGEQDDGQNLLVVHNGKAKIKKLIKYGPEKYLMVSLNTDVKSLELNSQEDIQVIGAVKKVICTL